MPAPVNFELCGSDSDKNGSKLLGQRELKF